MSDSPLDKYLREKIREWLAQDPRRTATGLARAAGWKPSFMSLFRSGQRGAGPEKVAGMVRALGLSAADVLRVAEGAEPDPYPARAIASEFARQSGASDDAILLVRAMVLDHGHELTPADWWEEIRSADRRRSWLDTGKPLPEPDGDAPSGPR